MMNHLDEQQQRSARQFESQAANYGKTHILSKVDDLRGLLELIPAGDRGGKALDVATGGGHAALALAAAGYAVTLGDVSPAMLAAAKRLLLESDHHSDGSIFPAELMPFGDRSFDLICCRVAAHHFSSISGFLAESFRVLRPGGWIAVIDGSVPEGDPAAGVWLNHVEKLRDPSHVRLLSRPEWEELICSAGFEIHASRLESKEQPDLEWYLNAAATPAAARDEIRVCVDGASDSVRHALQLVSDGCVQWTWPMVHIVASKPDSAGTHPSISP